MKTIKLQGIHNPQPAIEAKDLQPGMTRLYNYGETGEIVSVVPSKTGKTVTVTVRENGQEYTHRMNAGTLVAVVMEEAATAPQKSEEIRKAIKDLERENDEAVQRMVYQNPEHTPENHTALWSHYWDTVGWPNHKKSENLRTELLVQLNREIEVGDGVTMYLYSDAHACTVIARTDKTLTIQRDKATRDLSFKPEWVPGGFSAICTNSGDQKWTYERDPDGEIIKCRWSEKHGRWQTGSDGSIKIGRGRYEHYDYNF